MNFVYVIVLFAHKEEVFVQDPVFINACQKAHATD